MILAPLYQPDAGDAAAGARSAYFKSKWTPSTTAATMRKYRWYGVDELADGHWDSTGGSWVTDKPFDWSPLFPPDKDEATGQETPTYVKRYRPGSMALISLDSNGHPLKAELAIAMTNNWTAPSVFDADGDSATWQKIKSGWRLLEDRLGIEVTVEDPENWGVGKNGAVTPGGDIKGISWWAKPSDDNLNAGEPPVLRLTTVIEDDLQLLISEHKRTASPTQFARWRVADARDHFHYDSVAVGSVYYSQDGGNGTDPYVVRDDTKAAQTHCKQLRAAHELPPIAGSLTFPFITTYYEVGDRIWKIQGRNVFLRTNIAADQGEAPEYPWVVGVSFLNGEHRQGTQVQLSDHRAEPRNP